MASFEEYITEQFFQPISYLDIEFYRNIQDDLCSKANTPGGLTSSEVNLIKTIATASRLYKRKSLPQSSKFICRKMFEEQSRRFSEEETDAFDPFTHMKDVPLIFQDSYRAGNTTRYCNIVNFAGWIAAGKNTDPLSRLPINGEDRRRILARISDLPIVFANALQITTGYTSDGSDIIETIVID